VLQEFIARKREAAIYRARAEGQELAPEVALGAPSVAPSRPAAAGSAVPLAAVADARAPAPKAPSVYEVCQCFGLLHLTGQILAEERRKRVEALRKERELAAAAQPQEHPAPALDKVDAGTIYLLIHRMGNRIWLQVFRSAGLSCASKLMLQHTWEAMMVQAVTSCMYFLIIAGKHRRKWAKDAAAVPVPASVGTVVITRAAADSSEADDAVSKRRVLPVPAAAEDARSRKRWEPTEGAAPVPFGSGMVATSPDSETSVNSGTAVIVQKAAVQDDAATTIVVASSVTIVAVPVEEAVSASKPVEAHSDLVVEDVTQATESAEAPVEVATIPALGDSEAAEAEDAGDAGVDASNEQSGEFGSSNPSAGGNEEVCFEKCKSLLILFIG
jgi:hypothetical protein